VTTFHLAKGPAEPARLDAGRHADGFKRPSALSSSLPSGLPAQRQTGRDCPATTPPRSRRLLLRPHSPTTAFQAPGRPSQAPATTPAAVAVPGLAVTVHQSVTSLEGVTPRVHVVCPPSRNGIVSTTKTVVISAGRNKKHPLTHQRGFFAVWHRL
jgi:hypothetical protein